MKRLFVITMQKLGVILDCQPGQFYYVDDIFAVKSVITKFIHSLPTAGYDIDATEAHAKTSVIVL